MASFEWFVTENSGALAAPNTRQAHLETLQCELAGWAMGVRNPQQIAALWGDRLHAGNVAAGILSLKDGLTAKTPREMSKV